MAQLQYIYNTASAGFSIPITDFSLTRKIEFKLAYNQLGYNHIIKAGGDYGDFVIRYWSSKFDIYLSSMSVIVPNPQPLVNEPITAVWDAVNGKCIFNGIEYTTTGTPTPNGNTVQIGNGWLITYYYMSFYDENNHLLHEYVPYDNGATVGIMDNVTNTFHAPSSGLYIAGPVAHTFSPSKSSLKFVASGGTDTFDVEAETTWTASTPTFVSLSPSTGDTGTTTVTVTCPSYSGETKREETITFTDNDSYTFDVKMRQRGNSAGYSNIYLGEDQLSTSSIYIGENNVNTIYLGENEIFSSGPFVGLKASPNTLDFTNSNNTANMSIRSSEDWTITDDSGGWLSYSTTTGTTGKTVVTVTASTTQADRTATITVRSANYSATIGVQEIVYLKPQYNEIYYTTRTGNPIGSQYNQGSHVVSIAYDGYYGIITFDGVPYLNGLYAGGHYGGTGDATCWWLPENITSDNANFNFEWQPYCTEMFCYMKTNVPYHIFYLVQEDTPAVMHIPNGCSSAYANSGIFGANKSNWTVVDDL